MDDLRLNRKDALFIAACLIILAAGVWVGFTYFYQAFPESSITFRYDRQGSGRIATDFWSQVGVSPPVGYTHASRFGYDGHAKIYLEKELGVEGAQKYFGHPIRLWYWQHRWYKPSTKEEFKIFVTPEGEVVRVDHQVAEDAEGADLPQDSARVIAEKFLYGAMKQDSASLVFLEAQHTGRPHRGDWSFTWKAKGIEPLPGSEYRYQVGLIGDSISSYNEYLKVPEAWSASYAKLRSYNNSASTMDGVGFLLTAIAIVGIFFLRTRRRDIKWRTAIWFGIVAAGLTLLNQINDFPLELYGYDTTASWSGFLLEKILTVVLSAAGSGGLILILTAAAETLYREKYKDKLALPRMFSLRALRTKSAFKSILLGITLTAFFFAYQIVFYLVAGKFGAWSPSDVPYDDLLNTAMPWLAVLAMGFFPAVTEEFMSRMFSIPFLQKAFKSKMTWLAVVLPAVIWGFGHAAYPNQPFWIRGMEVGMAGIVIGVIMLKFGILTTLVWHYTVDAMYTAFLLFRSENPYFVLTASVAAGLLVIPLLVAVIAYMRKGSFASEAGLLNGDEGTVPEEAEAKPELEPSPTAPTITTYRHLPTRNRLIALGIFVVGAAAAFVPMEKLGDFISYPVSKDAAVKVVADSLRKIGWANPDTLKMAAFAAEQSDASPEQPDAYLLKHAGSLAAFNRIEDERLNTSKWRVLAWVPENRLRYMATVSARTGRIVGLYPFLPEEMPGDSLKEDSAKALVDNILTARGEDLSKLDLKDHRQYAKPKRLDYSFSYEAREGDPRNVGEAKYRRNGSVYGDKVVVNSSQWYKIPETWEREREATTSIRAIRKGLSIAAIVLLVVWGVVTLVFKARKGEVPWKKGFRLGIVPGALALLAGINQFYLSQADYFQRVETPWAVFRTTMIVTYLIAAAVTYIYFSLAVVFLESLYPEKTMWLKRHERRAAWLDAMLSMAAGIGAYIFYKSFSAWLAVEHPAWIPFNGWDVPEWIAAPLPLTKMIFDAFKESLVLVALLAAVVYLWNGPLKKLLYRLLLVIGALFMFMQGVEPTEWFFSLHKAALLVLLVWLLFRFVIVGRPVSFFAMIFGVAVYAGASGAIGLGNPGVEMQAWIFVVIAVIALLWWLGPVFHKKLMSAE